ncbi:MAG: hypothetical protein V1932_04270 [Chloroflexota bacterium]
MRHSRSYVLIGISLLLILFTVISGLGCTSKTGPQTTSSQQEEDKGDPDWWKKQPDLAKEEAGIKNTITGLTGALGTKDTQQTLTYFAPEEKDKYEEILSKYPDIMPQLAKDLEKATLIYLSPDTDNTLYRIAEYSIPLDGNSTVSIVFVKVDGKWLLKSL